MKKTVIILPLILLISVWGLQARNGSEKHISHTFHNLKSDGTISIDTHYTQVRIDYWDRNYAEVTVDVKVTDTNDARAQRMLDNINVDFTESGGNGFIKTSVKFENSNGRGHSFEIHCTVNVPRGMALNVKNRYGNVDAGDIDGKLSANIKYGNLSAGQVSAAAGSIDIQYGNVDIGGAPQLRLSIAYGNFNAEKIDLLTVSSKYSTLNIAKVDALQIQGSAYDTYKLREATTVDARSGTAGITIGKLHKSIYLPGVKYGNVVIDQVMQGFESIEIKAAYSSVKVGFDTSSAFGYDLRTRYGSISVVGLNSVNRIYKSDPGRSAEFIGGVNGYSGSKTAVTVSVSYGNIEFRGL